jgi:hypothetical protein
MKKLFGGLNITWIKLIIFAVIAGIYTGVMAALPATKDTSFADISISFEWWVLFGIIIIMNSKSPLDSALKCFVFFLISQPLVYLVQVPFNVYGLGIFRYYKPWFIWTLFTFPMGFIGHYMKKDKWWSIFILIPMLFFVGYHYLGFFHEAVSFFPNHLLSAVFCAVTMVIYSLCCFEDKRNRLICLIVSIALILGASVFALMQPKSYYNTTILVNGGSLKAEFDDSYSVRLEDESYGKVFIVYEKNIEDYMVNAEFSKTGSTKLILTAPDGTQRVFDLVIERSSYRITDSK